MNCRSVAALCLLATALSGTATAQGGVRGSIEGTVTAGAGSPIAGARVGLGNPVQLTVTDSLGRFRFAEVPPGDRRVSIRALGFRPVSRLVSVGAFEVARLDVALEASAVALPDVVISTSRDEQLVSRTPLSIDVIGAAEIREARSHHPADIVNRSAGVYVSNFGGEGHATAIRQPITTKAVYAYLEDGVPTRSTGFFNHNALYEINLPQAGRIEVIKGPGSAVYGSDAVGGVINSFTRDPAAAPEAELFIEGGSGTYLRALGTASSTVGRHGFRADANVTSSNGWRERAPYDRQGGTLRWDVNLGSSARVKTIATLSHIDQPGDGGGDIDADDFASAPSRTYTQVAFRRVLAGRLSSELQLRRGGSTMGATIYTRYNELDLLPSWQLGFDPQVWESRHRSIGALTRLRRAVEPLRATVNAGVDVEYSPGSRRETRIIADRSGKVFTGYTEAEIQYDYDVSFWQAAPYAQADFALTDDIQVDAGLRFDNLGYDYENLLTPTDAGSHRRPASTSVSFARLTPKVGVAWEMQPGVTAFASYRAAFRAPSESQLFRQGRAESTVDLEPVKARSIEGGVRALIGGKATVEATVYSMRLRDDILTFLDPAGLRLTQNAGTTTHRGVEVGLGVAPLRGVRLDASMAYAKHTYDEWQPAAALDFSGNEMELAPRFFANARATFRPAFLGSGSVGIAWVRLGSYFMDPENTHEYGGHDLFNVNATLLVHGQLELVGRVTNIANRRYAETSSFTAQQGELFRPGAPRQLFIGAQYRFDR
jgi:iron complex outermembrane receptor protein